MALTNTNIPSAASDVVAILDSNFNQVLALARPIKARINETSKPMEHPVETGVIITDHRIILPIEIELHMILPAPDYRSVYEQIKLLYTNAPLLIVQTRTSTYTNMVISQIPHDEDADLFDAIPLALKLKQVQIVTPQSGTLPASSVADTTDQSTVDRGNQQIGSSDVVETTTPEQARASSGIVVTGLADAGTDQSALPQTGIVIRPISTSSSIGLQPVSVTSQQTQDIYDGALPEIGNALPP